MYLHNGIVYAGELVDEIRVKEAKALPFGMLLLTFSTGAKKIV